MCTIWDSNFFIPEQRLNAKNLFSNVSLFNQNFYNDNNSKNVLFRRKPSYTLL